MVVSVSQGNKRLPKPNDSAFDDVWGWWRADAISGSAGSYILNDLSQYDRDMTQAGGTITTGTAANGQAKLTGNGSARFTSSASLSRWPCTIITVGLRAAGATMGFFGHQGSTPFNSLWHGYETVNRNFIYHTSQTNNTTAEAGTTSCYVARIGYGSRVAILDGIILADMLQASMINASNSVSIGTEYRGLNGDWQECLVWDRVLSLAELDEVHAYINTRYTKTIPLWSSYTPAPTVWLGGQSNAAGRGDRGASDANIPAEYDAALTGVNIWAGTGTWGTEFQTLNVNTNNHNYYEPANAALYFGPELTMGKEYIDRVGGSLYIVKVALGSTWLTYQASANGYWEATANATAQDVQSHRFNVAARSWWTAMRVFQQAGQLPSMKGIIFYQGEQDATVEAVANMWSASAVSFFHELERELGVTGPKIVCRLNDECPETYAANVISNQTSFATNRSGFRLVDTNPYSTRPGDPVHLGFQGQLDLGTYLASIL